MSSFWIGLLSISSWANFSSDHLSHSANFTADVVVIRKIVIHGNKVTRKDIILRELSIKENNVVHQKQLALMLENDRHKIYNLQLFNTVSIKAIAVSKGTMDIIIYVSERWYIFPIPMIFLSDRNFNEWWTNYYHDFSRINYGLRLEHKNFRGRNEKLRVHAHLGFTHKINLSYHIPYINKTQKQGLSFMFNYETAKNVAYYTENHRILFLSNPHVMRVSRQGELRYLYRNSFYKTHTLSIAYHHTSIVDTIGKILNENYFGQGRTKQKIFLFGYTYDIDNRDVRTYPLVGSHFQAKIKKIGLGYNPLVNLWSATINYAHHSTVAKNTYFSNYSSLYTSNTEDQPYSWYGSIGRGSQTLRGYEVNFIEGPHFILNKTTLKHRLFNHFWKWNNSSFEQFNYFPVSIYWKIYTDMGYVKNYTRYQAIQTNTAFTNTLLMGFGSGLDFVLLYDLVLRFEYSLTLQKTRGFFFNIRKEF